MTAQRRHQNGYPITFAMVSEVLFQRPALNLLLQSYYACK